MMHAYLFFSLSRERTRWYKAQFTRHAVEMAMACGYGFTFIGTKEGCVWPTSARAWYPCAPAAAGVLGRGNVFHGEPVVMISAKMSEKSIFTNLKKRFEHIKLPAKLLDYFLRSNKSNINQSGRRSLLDAGTQHA